MTDYEKMKLPELAKLIAAHLRRFENDPEINYNREYDQTARKWVRTNDKSRGTSPYYQSSSHASGGRVWVRYVAYQGRRGLTKAQAIAYLAWLDAGNVGTVTEVPDLGALPYKST